MKRKGSESPGERGAFSCHSDSGDSIESLPKLPLRGIVPGLSEEWAETLLGRIAAGRMAGLESCINSLAPDQNSLPLGLPPRLECSPLSQCF